MTNATEFAVKYASMFNLLDTDGSGDLYAADMEALGERLIAAFGDAVDPAKAATVRAGFVVYWEGLAAQMGGGEGPFTREQFTTAVTAAIGESEQGFDELMRPLAEAVFALIDANGSGAISLDEFRRAEAAMGVRSEDSERTFGLIDTDGDGEIDRQELVAAVGEYYQDPSADSPMSGFFGALNR
ncbi:EF-hand domain-containing protein [Glycomyces sp. A-F 0318]|uniref:EF-hand domain-containing protein n=1 Tax=Glycomyces amatae TaxID=2881355 RepID=UPI001E28B7AC|nr:EF-hand domain-containing protein [Glycomyces amatae]MCD0443342.1 EF-hand domain-containing protein [Glycomyces amatae]